MDREEADAITASIIEGLKNARIAQGLSHDKVAEKTGLHRSTISLIESGKRSPTLRNCLLIADALSVSFSELIKHPKI